MVLLIEYTDHLGANLAGCGTVTLCDVMHEGTQREERGERGDIPSPAGALPEPLAM
jgi:hypothetical protein